MKDRNRQRLERQLDAIAGRWPRLRGLVAAVRGRPGMMLRLPLGLALVAGGVLAILPVFGLWMIPLGLLILALDLPPLRPAMLALIVLMRRKITLWRRRGSNRRR